MVNQVTNNLLDDYHPSSNRNQASNPTTSNELISGYNQVSLIYDNASPPHQQSVHQQPIQQQSVQQQSVQQQSEPQASGSGASYSNAACSTSYYYPSYSNVSYQSSSFSSAPFPTASFQNASFQNASFQSGSFASPGPSSSAYPPNSGAYPPATGAPYYYPADQYHNSQLIRRNSFNNYDQSTDSEQYLINSYYELSDQLEQVTAAPHPAYAGLPEQDQQFIENYHHLNYSSNQIANNPNYIGFESYPAEYLTDRENALNFNSMIIFDSSLCQRFRERLKHVCSKNLPCMLIVLMPIFFATILILFFVRIYKSDKTDKDDLHAYAIYAFIIFSILFISPFALFFSIVVINKIIKKYNKCFNPNFIGSNEFGDLIGANAVDPASLLTTAGHPSTQTSAYQHPSNANLTVNLANTSQTHDLHPSPLLNGGQLTDLQAAGLSNGLANSLAIGASLGNATLSGLALSNAINGSHDSSQQISTLNVNQLQYNSANNRQLINEMIEEFDAMNPADQERTLQRMSSIQRRQRLIRQNAFESATFDTGEQQQPSLSDLICYDDKPPSYELALLCPKKRDCEPADKTKKETDKKSASKLASDCINYVNLSENLTVRDLSVRDPPVRESGRPEDRDGSNVTVGSNTISNTSGLPANSQANNPSGTDESHSTLQTELRNNLENRRRSSNGSSINTEPPTYSSLYQKEDDAK